MKLIPALMAVLGRSAGENRCLTRGQIYNALEVKDPAVEFRMSGAMEGLISIGIVGEAEGLTGRRMYYLKENEEELIRRGVLSNDPHIYITIPDGGEGVDTLRVDRCKVSSVIWQGLVRGDREAMLSLVVRGEKGR